MVDARGACYLGQAGSGGDRLERVRTCEHGRVWLWLGVTPAGEIRAEEQRHHQDCGKGVAHGRGSQRVGSG
jgi:hypothetical protein